MSPGSFLKSRYGIGNNPGRVIFGNFTILSVFLTIPISFYFAVNYNLRADLLSFKNQIFEKSQDEINEKELILVSQLVSDKKYMNELIKSKTIEEIADLSISLFETKIVSNQKAAASISLKGGQIYRNPPLLYRAARYYMAAQVRDYDMALEILNNQYIADDGLSDYYRGLIWIDAANPKRNPEMARAYFEKARDAGIRAAEPLLLKLEAH